jgi:hypothetical protein
MPDSHERASQKNVKPKETHKTAGCPKKDSGLQLILPAMSSASGVKSDGNNGLTSEDKEDELYGKQVSDDEKPVAKAHSNSLKYRLVRCPRLSCTSYGI